MTRSEWPNFLRPLSASIALLLFTACGGGSGPQLPMRPDAGDTDGGISGFAITTPADNTVLTLDDDADGDPSNGVQLTVEVAADDTISGTFDLSNNDPALSYETLACLLIIDTPDQRADAIDKLKIIKSN